MVRITSPKEKEKKLYSHPETNTAISIEYAINLLPEKKHSNNLKAYHEPLCIHVAPQPAVPKSSSVNPLPNPPLPKWVIIISLSRDPKYLAPSCEQPATTIISPIGVPLATSSPT